MSISAADWQIQIASRPKRAGKTSIRMEGHTMLRSREIIRALRVLAVDCQNEIIKML